MKSALLISLAGCLLVEGAAIGGKHVRFNPLIQERPSQKQRVNPQSQEQELTILHTNDIHSHFDEFNKVCG
jgi:2',3'-cyclic-nucleotide 2'-phosphodiesterase (5'-nucleotidase family)